MTSNLKTAAFVLCLFGVVWAGVAEDRWWSLQPMAQGTPPARFTGTPIDSFILEKLDRHGLTLSREADRRTLIRRLYFDLIGLPPTPEEVRLFEADRDPSAYERVVDRLLASPHYGERWARHWLDVVHYGDTHGYDKDQPRPNAWPYRDYVIRAFNEDKPYTRFVREQIAGDVLFPGSADGIEALGFISAGPWDFIGHAEVAETKIDGKIARHLDRDDMVANTISTFNSMTAHCAQCHNHKFDPISAEDYYSLHAVFAAVDRTNVEYYRDPDLTLKRKELKEAERSLARRKAESKDGSELAQTTNRIAAIQKELAAMPAPKTAFVAAVHHGGGAFRGTGPDGGKPRPITVLARGDVRKPGKPASPGALSAIPGLPSRFAVSEDAPEGERREALAFWLTHPAHPLTWRSIVNRIWQYHFGRGIVDTPNDFGRMGSLPSHPELLDWLAVEFRDGGQSFKALHKSIVMSRTYRQVSVISDENKRAVEVDSENRLLWRMNRRKLEAEAIRDSVLAVSGKLHSQMFGPGFQDFIIEKPEHSPHYQYHLHDPDDPRTHRRSIYRFIVRSQQQPFMTTLDCADPSMLVDKRNESLSALQALALLNNGFMVTMARHFAGHAQSGGSTLAEQVDRAFATALSRPATESERRELVAFAGEHGLANLGRLLFNLNEFAYVD